jgi:hypothetical protein
MGKDAETVVFWRAQVKEILLFIMPIIGGCLGNKVGDGRYVASGSRMA